MLSSSKSLTLIEQKKLQWAKEKEEMEGMYGLWGRPRNFSKNENELYCRNNLLPPIQARDKSEELPKQQYRPEDESETSGYLSDSPKHLKQINNSQEQCCKWKQEEQFNDAEEVYQQNWNETDNSEKYWAEKKIMKNYKNENWAHHNSENLVCQNPRFYQNNKKFWYGTPDSVSSDDGSRLRWGDRGIGIGHLWDPAITVPDSRLPLVTEPYGATPKWVEKGLKNADGNNADILIIHHPNDEQLEQRQKNFLLGQNVFIPPEVIEERERKRKKALEHQNAIKKQLEEREIIRKQERENRIREERLEEERIKKEQEIERLRFLEEQKKIKEKEEMEKKKEEAMREAIEKAERRATEEKLRNKKHLQNNLKKTGDREKVEKIEQTTETSKIPLNTPKYKKDKENLESGLMTKREQNKTLKDSSCQFEEIQLVNNFQFLNMNGMPMEGGLALMLDSGHKDNFLVSPEGVQLAVLVSPRNPNSTNSLLPVTPLLSNVLKTGERTLTPSKFRKSGIYDGREKSTQTDFGMLTNWFKTIGSARKRGKQNNRSEIQSGRPQKCKTLEKEYKHIRCCIASKYRSTPNSSKMKLEDRPKWGINRPSVQYKKQSEKDPYYQKKIKEKLRKSYYDEEVKSVKNFGEEGEKELDYFVRHLNCQTDEEEKTKKINEEDVLRNGYRMNSNLSSPMFIPIGSRQVENWNDGKKSELDPSKSKSINFASDDCEDTPVTGSRGFLTQSQLETITQITSLREGLKKLQENYSHSRNLTPFSDKSSEK